MKKRSRADSAEKQEKDIENNGKWARDRVPASTGTNLENLSNRVSQEQAKDRRLENEKRRIQLKKKDAK